MRLKGKPDNLKITAKFRVEKHCTKYTKTLEFSHQCLKLKFDFTFSVSTKNPVNYLA